MRVCVSVCVANVSVMKITLPSTLTNERLPTTGTTAVRARATKCLLIRCLDGHQ